MGWPGNRFTGARSAAIGRAGALSLLSKIIGVAGAGFNVVQGVQSVRQGDNAAAAKSGVDAAMGVVGSFGGPVGAVAGGVYFGVDVTIGWPRVGRELMKCDANCQYRVRSCTFANK